MEAIAQLIVKNSTLKILMLGNNRISSFACLSLSAGMAEAYTLTKIVLDNNSVGDEGVSFIAKGLRRRSPELRSLQYLYLQNTECGNEGARALGIALQNNHWLLTLNLGNNNIGDEGAEALAEGLSQNNTLRDLNVNCNRIGNIGLDALADMLVNWTHFLIHVFDGPFRSS